MSVQQGDFRFAYGTNPHQRRARVYVTQGHIPFNVLHGRISYNNLADALHAWSVASELRHLTGKGVVVAAKYGRLVGASLVSSTTHHSYHDNFKSLVLNEVVEAALRARDTDPLAAINDWLAVSETVDEEIAKDLTIHQSDGLIAPNFNSLAIERLQAEGEHFRVIRIDSEVWKSYEQESEESRFMFGMMFEQERNNIRVVQDMPLTIATKKTELPPDARLDLLFGMIITKYTPARAVCVVKDGQTLAIASGEQSEIESVRVATAKSDLWHVRQLLRLRMSHLKITLSEVEYQIATHWLLAGDRVSAEARLWQNYLPELDDEFTLQALDKQRERPSSLALCSSVSFQSRDSIERAHRSGITFILQPDVPLPDLVKECDDRGIVLASMGKRMIWR